MDSMPVKIPKNAVEDLARLFIPQNTPEDSYLELIIKIKTDNLTFRELTYLVLIDKYYGYLYPEGIYAYSHKEEETRISEIKNGCIEVIIRKVISSVIPGNLVILLFLLKISTKHYKIIF
ncbi:MAG: hypothetical protein KF721_15670 [Ignavibacteriaceae bacterium]|nr:hypothetical protein [Ignavibacteriaceae bacterium]